MARKEADGARSKVAWTSVVLGEALRSGLILLVEGSTQMGR